MNSSSRRSTKVLAPLAVLLAAGALAVGSGATFTSASSNSISSVTAGSLTQSNSKQGQAVFSAGNIKPGDSVDGSVTITNTGTLPADFTLTQAVPSNTFVDQSTLTLEVMEGAEEVYNGQLMGLTSEDLGTFTAGQARTFTFTVELAESATNAEQGKTVEATYTWDAVQTD